MKSNLFSLIHQLEKRTKSTIFSIYTSVSFFAIFNSLNFSMFVKSSSNEDSFMGFLFNYHA